MEELTDETTNQHIKEKNIFTPYQINGHSFFIVPVESRSCDHDRAMWIFTRFRFICGHINRKLFGCSFGSVGRVYFISMNDSFSAEWKSRSRRSTTTMKKRNGRHTRIEIILIGIACYSQLVITMRKNDIVKRVNSSEIQPYGHSLVMQKCLA